MTILKKNTVGQYYINRIYKQQTITKIATSVWTEAFNNEMSIQCVYIVGRKYLSVHTCYAQQTSTMDVSPQTRIFNPHTPSIHYSIGSKIFIKTSFRRYRSAQARPLAAKKNKNKQLCKCSILSYS